MDTQQNSQFLGHLSMIPLPGHVSTSQVAKSTLPSKSFLSSLDVWQRLRFTGGVSSVFSEDRTTTTCEVQSLPCARVGEQALWQQDRLCNLRGGHVPRKRNLAVAEELRVLLGAHCRGHRTVFFTLDTDEFHNPVHPNARKISYL